MQVNLRELDHDHHEGPAPTQLAGKSGMEVWPRIKAGLKDVPGLTSSFLAPRVGLGQLMLAASLAVVDVLFYSSPT